MATGRVPTTANSPLTAKGDLFTYSTAPARLAVGNSGEQIVADSSAATGLAYIATPSASNPVLNSAMQVWQRGTSISLAASTAYTSGFLADRWQTSTAANQATTVSRQATGDTTNLPSIQYAMRFQRNSGQTGTTGYSIVQSFESINSIPFAGKTVTMSFYARAGATAISSGATTITQYLYTGTGTDQNIFAGFTGSATPINSAKTLTATWQRFTTTAALASTTTQLAPVFVWTPIGTAGATDYVEITGVQIDIGSVALPFRTNGGTFQGELAACQRYAFALTRTTGYNDYAQGGTYDSTTEARVAIPFTSQMRTSPTMTTTGTAADYGVLVAAGNYALTGVPTLQSAHPQGATINLPRSGIYSTGQSVSFRDQNTAGTATYVLLFTAEL